jgi:hypothetical protein
MPSNHEPNAAYWHKCEVPRCLLSRRYRVMSRRGADIVEATCLTKFRHMIDVGPAALH